MIGSVVDGKHSLRRLLTGPLARGQHGGTARDVVNGVVREYNLTPRPPRHYGVQAAPVPVGSKLQ